MEEMISRDAVLTILNHNWGKPKGYSQSMNEISELPTIQPRIGHWCMAEEAKIRLENGDTLLGWMPWVCSECGGAVGKHQTSYCPTCGAHMIGEENG